MGSEARMAGVPREACPLPHNKLFRAEWEDGWDMVDLDLRQGDPWAAAIHPTSSILENCSR